MKLATLLALLAPLALRAQAPVFEVTSIKPSPPGQSVTSSNPGPGGTLTIKNYTLKSLIMFAYDVFDFQISGGPGWIASDRYDIVAKPAPAAVNPPPELNDGQILRRLELTRLRVQALLADRFQLQIHRESKELSTYALLLAKGAPKLQENHNDSVSGSIITYTGRLTAVRTSMQDLAKALSRELGRPVADQTGLTAAFDFKLTWTPDSASPETAAASENPTLFTALQQQLGLRLDSRKGPVEVIVVDRAARPSEN